MNASLRFKFTNFLKFLRILSCLLWAWMIDLFQIFTFLVFIPKKYVYFLKTIYKLKCIFKYLIMSFYNKVFRYLTGFHICGFVKLLSNPVFLHVLEHSFLINIIIYISLHNLEFNFGNQCKVVGFSVAVSSDDREMCEMAGP